MGAVERPRDKALAEVRFLTVAEVAALMRVSKMTVYRLVHSGELPAVRVGRSFRVPEQAVHDYLRDAFIEAGRAPGASDVRCGRRGAAPADPVEVARVRLEAGELVAGSLVASVKSNVGTGPGGSGFGRGFGHQEAPQADGEEEAPQAAEAHARSAPQQEVAPKREVAPQPASGCGAISGLARQLRQDGREVEHAADWVAG